MPSVNDRLTGQAYWRSLDELANTPRFRQFVEAEFPSMAPELLSSTSRRNFLKLMGASMAMAGLTGCRWPKETIVPYGDRPDNRIPGIPVHYATGWEVGGIGHSLLVKSFDGRPIKVDGNDAHPLSGGRSTVQQQASVLGMYDPDRSRSLISRAASSELNQSWAQFAAWVQAHIHGELKAAGGRGLAILSEESSSPTFVELRSKFQQAFPSATWHTYEPVSRDNEREGARLAFGRPYRPVYRIDKTDVLVALDADLFGTHPAAVYHTRMWADRRRADDGQMIRLWALESGHSLTGGLADERLIVRNADLPLVAAQLVVLLAEAGAATPGAETVKQHLAGATAEQKQMLAALPLADLVQDLVAHRGRAAIAAGPRLAPETQALVALLNEALGAYGSAVELLEEPDADRPPHARQLAKLVEELQGGQVDTLVILGGNPVYTAPADLNFAEALARARHRIHLSLYNDATSQQCTWHLPQAHYLESWGDVRAWDGTVSIQQPLIQPLYDGKTNVELLALLTGDDLLTGYELVRRTFAQRFAKGGDIATAWQQALHDGFVAGTGWPAQKPSLGNANWAAVAGNALANWQPPADGAIEVLFAEDYSVYDGRFANNGWLQEFPDPLTKLTWDNAALLSPAMARRLRINYGDMVEVEVGGRKLKLAAEVLPGHHPDAITLALGYGHGAAAGRVAEGAGFNTYLLRGSEQPWRAVGKISKARGEYKLVGTQDHHAITSELGEAETQRRLEHGVLVREGTLTQYQHDPKFAKHGHHALPLFSLWEEQKFDEGYRWGMAIDLSTCTGCGACVVACQAENNIPVVGKREVSVGREMHWIRVDRYFKGPAAAPQLVQQPIPCQHCENAPCEQVCPVAATVHDEEGLNVMVYNRCIGTRYCSNNCPYKVRRFNWFYNHHGPYHPYSDGVGKQAEVQRVEMMVYNPDVTVRTRGVMEKCTFCTQRIQRAKIHAKNEQRRVRDGEVVTACQQACPADAILFGNLNDPEARVRKAHLHNRSYALLEDLNVKPRVRYLAKLRHPLHEPADTGHGSDHGTGHDDGHADGAPAQPAGQAHDTQHG